MVDTQNTFSVCRPAEQNLAPQPLTPFSAVTVRRATASRPRRLISATTLDMILEEETEEENLPRTATAKDSLVVFPTTSCFLMSKKQVSFLLYGSCKCT
ncbi:hypothetical protein EUTSA_v10009968mg [Eutrema salsugineum]|uniref:Uncharacterized protein n=1 Tax=Eutrema salsugineum TaxID=72664 RepID=V4K887_EUTSA|nr:uncharacterized protein LOC18992077 [Eutrema salsugineum]ESQ33850.1 hypothetical protein EUTSA_v10009968mg [Eutrema salsugineum]